MALHKPSDKEDEYIKKQEFQKLKDLRSELDAKREKERKKRQKEAHWMKCPKCGSDLEEVKYQDVAIDRCGECGGLWLDQGELELLAKAEAKVTASFLNRFFSKKK